MKWREEIGETVDLKRCTAAAEPTRTAGAPSALRVLHPHRQNNFLIFEINKINQTWMRPIPSAVRVLHPHWDKFEHFSIFLQEPVWVRITPPAVRVHHPHWGKF
jgi:hypothetical protein